MSRFPVAFRPPAFASRSSDSRRGIGLSLRSAYRARPSARTSTGLPRSARTSCDRGGCSLYPEDDGAHPAGSPPRPAPAASQRQVLRSRQQQAIDGVPFTRHQTRVHAIHPSGLPLAHAPGMEPAALRLPPRASHPAVTGNARRGWGQAIEHGPGTTAQLTSVDLQSGSSLNACDLASHGESEVSPTSDRKTWHSCRER